MVNQPPLLQRHPARVRSLRAVDVLGLVDEQVGAGGPPPIARRRIGLDEPQRPGDEVVEVERSSVGERPLVRDVRPRDRAAAGIRGDLLGPSPGGRA